MRFRSFALAAALAIAHVVFAAEPKAGRAAKPGALVIGRVIDLATQRPIAGAIVTGLEREGARFGRDAAHSAQSGDDGSFQLGDCAPGIVVVEAIAPGKARARLDRVVAAPAL